MHRPRWHHRAAVVPDLSPRPLKELAQLIHLPTIGTTTAGDSAVRKQGLIGPATAAAGVKLSQCKERRRRAQKSVATRRVASSKLGVSLRTTTRGPCRLPPLTRVRAAPPHASAAEATAAAPPASAPADAQAHACRQSPRDQRRALRDGRGRSNTPLTGEPERKGWRGRERKRSPATPF